MDATDSFSSSRRPSLRGSIRRPQNAPMGPRTRNLSRNSVLPPPPRQKSVQGPSPRYSGPSSAENSDSKNLAAITEGEYESPPAPENDPPPHPPLQAPEVVPDEPLNVKSVPKVPGLTPPVQIKFESVPVNWKGLPLEAAIWTFNSKELQELVSRAIRKSAQESFVRVLSVENLDQNLPAELERLNVLKSVTQSKYRFTVHRRTMLLQALHSFSAYTDKEKDAELVAKLTSQLSQTTADCDQLLEDLLQIADQVGQITHLLDVHWSSALAIALRKLNGSYGRRTSDLLKARAKVASLEAELNDAWQQAEKLAREMDEFDADVGSDEDEGDAVIEVAESRRHLAHAFRTVAYDCDDRADDCVRGLARQGASLALADETAHPDPVRDGPSPNTADLFRSRGEPSPQTEDDPQTPDDPQSPDDPQTVDDAASIHSAHSARSTRSVRSVRSARSAKSSRTARTARTSDANRLSTVSAARRRSQRTSMGSLRMPNTKVQGRKGSHPPVPALPIPSPVSPDRRSTAIESFLDFDRDSEEEETDVVIAPRRTSIDDIEIVARTPVVTIQTRDDIHVMPSRSATENELVAPKRSQFSLDHQHPFANEGKFLFSIPSIWLLQDTPKTPAERVELMMRDHGGHGHGHGNAKMGSFQRLKSLTKRYSLPFPGVTLSTRSKPSRNATAGT
ncbi:hypothetical protein B0H13DRAFT_2277771 [Mycena leptocephala]|nr:hypothetical protein B0H13DRAFT_2277771 [Mycena leptocephala]